MSKAFDKVWHPGLLYKFESYLVKKKITTSSDQLSPCASSKDSIKWPMVQLGVYPIWRTLRVCLGPFPFFIYVNNLPEKIISICKIFADEKCLLGMNYIMIFNK